MICPLVLSVVWSSLIITMLPSISHLIVVSICLMYWGAPVVGLYIPIIIMSSWIEPYVVSFSVSYNGLYFKFYFIWYEYCFPCFLLVSVCIKCLFQPLIFSLYVFLGLKWVPCRQHIQGSYFCIHSASQCLLVGDFNPLTFKLIINEYNLVTI